MADSPESPEDRARLRDGLLDQLRHLIREVDMLEGFIARVPEKLLAEAPPDEDRSIKTLFALIARRDEGVHHMRAERIVAEDTPRLDPADPAVLLGDEDWNAQPITALFDEVRIARRTLVETLASIPAADWLRVGYFPGRDGSEDGDQERDLYEMAHAICQDDVARLEHMTRRLYESHMGPAPERSMNSGA